MRAERAKDFQSAAAVRKQNQQYLREGVLRLHRLGLSDARIANSLRADWRTVKKVREALGLPANPGGAL